MAIENDTPEYDDQDRAEMLDEDNLLPDADRVAGGDDGLVFEEMPNVYDSTARRGDDDMDGDDDALDEDEESDELLDSLGDTGDIDDDLDDDDRLEPLGDDDIPRNTLDVDFEDADLVDGVGRQRADEPTLIDVADADSVRGASGASVADYESSEELSDEDLMELDYKDPKTGLTRGAT